MLTKLSERRVPKPWGRRDLPAVYGPDSAGEPLGEIWFERPAKNDPILIKYLFTSEKLSIQVHPDDCDARQAGHSRGKDEAWFVIDAKPNAEIGVGLRGAVALDTVRNAALDGSLEKLVEWRSVEAGDAFYSPAGTLHSLGAGLIVLEIQQNADLTYRLFDFGRSRELHLEAGLDALKIGNRVLRAHSQEVRPGRTVVAQGPKFTIERWTSEQKTMINATRDEPVWLIPLSSGIEGDNNALDPPGVWVAESATKLNLDERADLLLAYEGPETRALG